MVKFLLAILWSGLVLSDARAASPFKQSLEGKKNAYLQDGLFIGGKAGAGTSILGMRHQYSKKAQIERLVVDLGDGEGKPLLQEASYFQASVDRKQNRIVLDLTQLKMSLVSEQKIRNLLRNSPYVASADFTLDPEDKAASLVLNLKRPMRLEVFQLLDKKKSARLVLDLKPAQQTAVKTR